MILRARIAGFLLLFSGVSCALTLDDCRQLRHKGKPAEARRCFAGLLSSPDLFVRAEAHWGLGQYREANDAFRLAVDRSPKNPDYRVRWGRLFLERYQKQEAAQLFKEALDLEPGHPGALLGFALVAAENFEGKAVEFAEEAIKADPRLLEARELLARLALEEGDEQRAISQADQALDLSAEALQAMGIRATIDWLNDRSETPWLARILRINPVYGEVYATAARFFVLNRRYEDGIRFYRKALELNPELWEARSDLGVNLMRVGQDQEARRHLEQCYANGYQSPATVNSLRLLDSFSNFLTFKTGNTVLKLHKREAALLRPYMEAELRRAIAAFRKKYKFDLPRPVQLEVYHLHEDFAVRTMGMPGLGALGVTFGDVVAMDSPSARPPGSFHWASTLWHELSHVFVLTATSHRVPRWFTEGMAVHEETAVSPEWGDRLSPPVIEAIRDKKLLGVAELDRGFVRPRYPAQVVASYFQAGRICDFINTRWGYDKLLEMMHAFSQRKTTPQVIEECLGMKPEEFDRRFLAWLEGQTRRTVEGFEDWKKRLRALADAAGGGRHEEVIREGLAIRDVYPDYIEAGNVYEFLAEAYLARGDKPAAAAELARYAASGGRDPVVLKKLAGLHQDLGRKKEAALVLDRINYIYPVQDEELHRWLGDLWFEDGNLEGAIREYQALVALNPLDQAGSYYKLARACLAANRIKEASEHLLLSLEAAPGYRPAQKMLLEINQAEEKNP